MNSSTAGFTAAAFSGTFSTTGILIPRSASTFRRASSSACDHPPSFFCENIIIAGLGSPLIICSATAAFVIENKPIIISKLVVNSLFMITSHV